jgi:hypothetical protein
MTRFLRHQLPQLLLLIGASYLRQTSCFVVSSRSNTPAKTKERGLLSLSSSSSSPAGQSREPRPLRPVFVMDDTATSASALALQTLKVLTGQVGIPPGYSDEAVPDGRLPIYLINSPHQLQEALQQHGQSEPILYFPIDATTTTGVANIHFEALQQAAFVGLGFYCDHDGDNDAALEMADRVGSAIKQAIQTFPHSAVDNKSPTMFLSLDLALYLAMLRTNALPKQQDPPHGDSYQVAMPEGGSTLIEYFYDHQNAFGGSDPLLCPTKETLTEAPPTSSSRRRSTHLGAAYTVLCGQGMNPLASAAVAASVATILGDGIDDDRTEVSWNVIERTVQLTHHIRQYGTKEQDPGFIRRKYKEFGYR